MQNEKHDDSANANSGKGATPDKPVESVPANGKEFWLVVRDAFGIVVSGIFAGIFFETDHKICGIWCSFIGLIAALDILFRHYAEKNPKKKTRGWVCNGIFLSAIAVWFLVWSYKIAHPLPTNAAGSKPIDKNPPFSVLRTTSFISIRTGSEHFWFVHPERIGKEVPPQFETEKSPINFLVYLRFSNLKDVPIEVDSYSAEIKTADGKWVECPSIDVRNGEVFMRTQFDFKNSIKFNFDMNNFAAVIGKPI